MYMLTSDSARLVLKQLIDSIQPYIEPILKESEGNNYIVYDYVDNIIHSIIIIILYKI